MVDHLNRVMFPASFQEIFSAWELAPEAVLCSGGTGFMRAGKSGTPDFPQTIISLDKMEELKKISRTERYIEIGAAVKLNQLAKRGKIVPEALSLCLSQAADVQVRNQATIGGNICLPSLSSTNQSFGIPDVAIPMIALDAQYELRTAHAVRWISAARFSAAAQGEILTRIRIPLETWTFTWYKKFSNSTGSTVFGNAASLADDSNYGSALFIMKSEKNILANLRVVCAGKTIFRDKSSEAMLLGKRLPLARKDADAFADRWKSYLSGAGNSLDGAGENTQEELSKIRVINFINSILRHISD
ncbi:MAG: FAD binding domain-containing protein [Treponema sp.]|nr:FAD binding domain-containing protein [Treponema sp.]